uniref:Uncharacterized protein LOC111116861 isoform X2 n=1 Tax=Crassostrea virginica TaxID=6565 RepID=A0A8B8C788_CRAVI|nr:uncharacterized protein LOC111116861 isoform X2 [Crassostrea virginica]
MIFLAVFFASQVAAIITNSRSVSEGFCEQDLVNLTLIPECDFSRIEVSIHMDHRNFSNLIVQCDNVTCVVHEHTKFKYVLTNQTLDVSFPFRHRDHGGKYINFRTTCNNTSILDHAFLKACQSGFTGNATFVGSKVKLDCQHSSFKESTLGIRITHNGNDIAHCVLKNCYPGTDLPNGVSIEIEYQTGMIFLCRMDGAVFNLTDKIIEMKSTQTQNAFSTTPMFSHDTSSPTSQSIPTMNSSLVTGEKENSANRKTRDNLMTLFIIILHIIQYITPKLDIEVCLCSHTVI